MKSYILRRLVQAVPTIIILTIILFLLVRLLPGDVIDAMSGGQTALDPARREAMLKQLGLRDPLYVQYVSWVRDVLSGNLGTSMLSAQDLRGVFLQALPITVELGLLATLIASGFGIPLGIIAAVRRNTKTDALARLVGIIGLTLPNFWLGTLILLFTSVTFHWVPGLFWVDPFKNPIENLKQMILPAAVLSFNLMAVTLRMTRATMQETLAQEYVRTAYAKGLKQSRVIIRHGLRNALIPVITIIGLQMGYLLSGSVIIEQIFGLPGIGRFFLQGLLNRDYPAIQIMGLFMVSIFVLLNLLTDIAYSYIDPRIRFE